MSSSPTSPTSPFDGPSPFAAPVQAPPPPSTGNFFTRARSSSLHAASSSTLFRRDESAPPVPSLPGTPLRGSPKAQEPSISPSVYSTETSDPHIKSVTVPHHSKSAKNYVFACRVVPEACAPTNRPSQPMARRTSLGRMEMAGNGAVGAREPHTVWRTYSEFVDFSNRLSIAFPVVEPSAGSNPSDLPSSFYRQTPRVEKKISIFQTKTALLHRQNDLDLFVRRLFAMPDSVRKSAIVRDFFRLRPSDLQSMTMRSDMSPPASAPSTPWDPRREPSEPVSQFAQTSSPNATVRPRMPKSRPALVIKQSTPNLRQAAYTEELGSATEGFNFLSRPTLMERAATLDPTNHPRISNYSISTSSSTSSSVTVTPQSFSASTSLASSRMPSPLFAAHAQADEEMVLPTPEPKKRPHLGALRHFRSLQDLRQSSSPSIPSEPVPKLASFGMLRAVTQPSPSLPSPAPSMTKPFAFPLSSTSTPPSNSSSPSSQRDASLNRSRSGSKSSTNSSEELWGTSSQYATQHTPSSSGTFFRHGPGGRLEQVPDSAHRPRRPSMPSSRSTGMSMATRASCGHSSSGSVSSIASTRSSRAGSSLDLTRSMSSGYSDGGSMSTPPTPHSEFGSSTKYYVENGVLSQNNKVPPPPFFPVPPSSSRMEVAYSHDGLPHSPRSPPSRRPSLDLRPRTASSASRLDTILGSPKFPSSPSPSSSSSMHSPRPQDRPYYTFKLLHSDNNLVMRVPRMGLSLGSLRSQVRDKFVASCGLDLGGDNENAHWGLAYTATRTSGAAVDGATAAPATTLIITENDLRTVLDKTAHLEKVSLRIIS